MSKQFYQKAIEFGIPFIGGILGLGGVLGSIVYAHELIGFRTAIIITVLFILSACLFIYKLKKSSIRWRTKKDDEFRLRKISRKIFISISGGIFLIWLPIIIGLLDSGPEAHAPKAQTVIDASIDSLSDSPQSNYSTDTKAKVMDSLVQKARKYVSKGELQKADSAYTQIFDTDNEARDYLIEAADFFSFKGNHLKAGALMKRLISLTTESQKKAYIYFVLAENYLSSFELDSAIFYFQKSSKEYYDLQIISKSYLPKYAFVKSEEIRIKNKIKKQPSQDFALDSIADLVRDCDKNICKSILFFILLDKINTGNSANVGKSTSDKSVIEANLEFDSAIEVGKELLRADKSYELPVQFVKLMRSLNNSLLGNSLNINSIDSVIDKGIQLCSKYSTMRIDAPEKYFLKDFPDIFRNARLKQDEIVGYNILLLKMCTQLTVILAKNFEAEIPLFDTRKKALIKCILSISGIYYKAFLKYPLINGSTPAVNMMDLSEIAFIFEEYDFAEGILTDLIKILMQKKDIDFLNHSLLYQAKHSLVVAKFNKIVQTNSMDTTEINRLYQMTEEIKKYYLRKYKPVSVSKNIRGTSEENESNLKLITDIQADIKNYKRNLK